MKICSKCGAQQSDTRIFCVDCGERLGDSLPEKASQVIEEETDNKINKLYNKTDPLYVSFLDKIVGFASLIGAVLMVIFMVVFRRNLEYVPESLYAIVLFLLSSLNALVPKILWAMEKIRLSFTINDSDNAEPSDFYLIMRKISIWICCGIGILFLVLSIINLINPPISNLY